MCLEKLNKKTKTKIQNLQVHQSSAHETCNKNEIMLCQKC